MEEPRLLIIFLKHLPVSTLSPRCLDFYPLDNREHDNQSDISLLMVVSRLRGVRGAWCVVRTNALAECADLVRTIR